MRQREGKEGDRGWCHYKGKGRRELAGVLSAQTGRTETEGREGVRKRD